MLANGKNVTDELRRTTAAAPRSGDAVIGCSAGRGRLRRRRPRFRLPEIRKIANTRKSCATDARSPTGPATSADDYQLSRAAAADHDPEIKRFELKRMVESGQLREGEMVEPVA